MSKGLIAIVGAITAILTFVSMLLKWYFGKGRIQKQIEELEKKYDKAKKKHDEAMQRGDNYFADILRITELDELSDSLRDLRARLKGN